MIDFFTKLFDTDGFPARWDCGSVWRAEPGIGWLHIVSDLGISVAYFAIPIGLAYFITRRRDAPFPRLFWLFAAFIFACGATHLIEAGLFYWPAYRFSGLMKAVTAGVSLATVATLLPLLPKALSLRSPGELEEIIAERTAELRSANKQLEETAAQRQKAEQSSRHAARRFLAMTESLPDIFFTADAALHTTSLNPAFTQLTGMAVQDGVDNGWLQAVHETDRERVRMALADAVASGVRFEHEFRLMTHEGGWRWMVGRASPVLRDDGTLQEWFGSLTDVHELKESEKSLQESAERLRLALAAGHMGTWDWNLDTGEVAWDAGQAALFGLEPRRTIIQVERFMELVHPDDREEMQRTLDAAMESGERYEHEGFRVIVPDTREVRWLAGEGELISDSFGRVRRMIGVNYDVTDRQLVDERLRQRTRELEAILEHMVDGVVVQNNRGQPMMVNAAAMRMYNLPDVESARRVLQQEDGEYSIYRKLDADGEEIAWEDRPMSRSLRWESFQDMEATIVHPDTGRRWTGVFTGESVAIDEDGASLFVTTIRDITERKKYELELKEARQAAEAASRAKSEFLANMSHEIRTPMSAILGYADLLAGELRESSHIDCIQTIKRNGQFLLEIINDILDLSRIEAGRFDLDRLPCRIDAVVEDVASLMQVRAASKDIELEVVYETRVPREFHTDATRLRQILVNLVGNAIKFTDRGSVRLVTRYVESGENSRLEFDVIDTGVGIPESLQRTLFEPFVQADTSSSRKVGGTGLGLTISRRLATMLDGAIAMSSVPGEGSTFRLVLNAAAGRPTDLIEVQARDGSLEDIPVTVGQQELSGCRVLVADDRREIRYLARRFLEMAGCSVTGAGDGREAVRLAQEAERGGVPFDIILMDIQMPLLDGYTATRILRGDGYTRPILALTADAMQGDREKCLNAGCTDYLTKPVDATALVQTVARYWAEQKSQTTTSGYPLAENEPEPAEDPAKDRARQVLLVEDSDDARQVMARLLELHGLQISTARDGQSACSAFRLQRPDVVLLDLGLPDMSGYDVLQQMILDQEQEPSEGDRLPTRFIALTGYCDEDDRARTREAGFHQHFAKPVDMDDLLRAIAGESETDSSTTDSPA